MMQDFLVVWKGVSLQMDRQRLFGIIAALVVIGGLFMFLRNGGREEFELGEGGEVNLEEVTSELSQKLGVSVAEDVERTSLRDLADLGASALATRSYSDGRFVHTVLAALPDPEEGKYQGWLVKGSEGEEDYSVVSTGDLKKSKGGYLLEFSSDSNFSDHRQVLVTVEKVDDGQPEESVLEGSFE